MTKKLWISVADPRRGGRARRICWYAGTSDAVVAQSARVLLQLVPPDGDKSGSNIDGGVVLLRDVDGDVVPLSGALPSGASFALVLPERLRDRRVSSGGTATASDSEESDAQDAHDSEERGGGEESDDGASTPPSKRRRTSLGAAGDASASTMNAAVATPSEALPPAVSSSAAAAPPPPRVFEAAAEEPASVSPSTPLLALPVALAVRRPPTRSVTTMVTHFLDAFTEAIANDDNVNFIPNTGRFALYALYSALVADPAYHPKNQDAFYKVTSMQGKVDRQRVNRYYLQAHAPSEPATTAATSSTLSRRSEAVQYKPQGKGPLLRKYRGDAGSALVERAGAMASALNLPPARVVDTYLAFVRGFQPISKKEFLAHGGTTRRRRSSGA